MSDETPTISDETLAGLLAWFDGDTPEGPTVKGAQVTAALRELVAARRELAVLEAEVKKRVGAASERQREALEFYANKANYDEFPYLPQSMDTRVERDEGEIARAALDQARKP